MQCWIFFKKIKKNTWRYYFTPVYQKYWYDPQFLRYRVWQTEFLSFWAIFALLLPLPPLTTQKIQILKNWKKMPGDIIILHMCTINETHVMYGSWDTECDILTSENLFSFKRKPIIHPWDIPFFIFHTISSTSKVMTSLHVKC